MSDAATEIRQPPPHRWKPGQSGNLKGVRVLKERADALFHDLAVDFGGVEALSRVDTELLRQACFLFAKAKSPRCRADEAIRMSGEARRCLDSIRRNTPLPKKAQRSLDDHLEAKYRRPRPQERAPRATAGAETGIVEESEQ